MIANYHTHTSRCRHAVGTEEEYVRCAMEGGLEILGFSDHTPYWFGCDYYSRFRMFPEQLGEYCDTVLSLRERYAGKLDIRLGLEAEYYPAYFPELMERLRDSPVEYLILGQHYVGNEIGEHYSGKVTGDEQILARYCDQCVEAMETGMFSYLAHPELLHFVGEDKAYRAHMRRLCKGAKACGLPVEINFLGLREGRHYPDLRFWEAAAEEGCKVVFGCDAHTPAGLNDPKSHKKAMAIVEQFKLELLEKVELKKI